jgi:hypothetical protein
MTDEPTTEIRTMFVRPISYDEMIAWLDNRVGEEVSVALHVLPGDPSEMRMHYPSDPLGRGLRAELGDGHGAVMSLIGELAHSVDEFDGTIDRGTYYVGDRFIQVGRPLVPGPLRSLGNDDATSITLDEHVRLVIFRRRDLD